MSNGTLPGHYQRLVAFAGARGASVRVVTSGVPMPTVPAAAAALSVTPTQILKSLLFVSPAPDRRVVLAIAAGTAKIDRQRLAHVTGLASLSLAPPALVRERTGFPVGGVPPFGHPAPLPVVIDQAVMALPHAYGGAGDENGLLEIRPRDLKALTEAVIADIVRRDNDA